MRMEYFYQGKPDKNLSFLFCGYEDCEKDFVCRPHIRPFYLVHYVTAGAAFYEENGRRHRAGAGSFFAIYPGGVVSYWADPAAGRLSVCWVAFSGLDAGALLEAAGAGQERLTGPCGALFYQSVMGFLKETGAKNEKPVSPFLPKALLYACLGAMEEKRADAGKNEAQNASGYVQKAKQFMEFNYMNPITVRDCAAFLNIDRTYFYRVFQKAEGASPSAYLMRLRIQKAKALLKTGAYTVSQVARFTGFSDIYYFSRQFKRQTGQTPTQFQQKE